MLDRLLKWANGPVMYALGSLGMLLHSNKFLMRHVCCGDHGNNDNTACV